MSALAPAYTRMQDGLLVAIGDQNWRVATAGGRAPRAAPAGRRRYGAIRLAAHAQRCAAACAAAARPSQAPPAGRAGRPVRGGRAAAGVMSPPRRAHRLSFTPGEALTHLYKVRADTIVKRETGLDEIVRFRTKWRNMAGFCGAAAPAAAVAGNFNPGPRQPQYFIRFLPWQKNTIRSVKC